MINISKNCYLCTESEIQYRPDKSICAFMITLSNNGEEKFEIIHHYSGEDSIESPTFYLHVFSKKDHEKLEDLILEDSFSIPSKDIFVKSTTSNIERLGLGEVLTFVPKGHSITFQGLVTSKLAGVEGNAFAYIEVLNT